MSRRRIVRLVAALVLSLGGFVAAGTQAAEPAAATVAWLYPGPSIAVTNALETGRTDQFVFWKGASSGYLFEAFQIGSNSWSSVDELSRSGVLGSEPSVALPFAGDASNPDNTYVVWRGTDSHLWLMYYDSGWHGPCDLGMGPIPGRPSIMSTAVTGGTVFTVAWKGADGNLWYADSPAAANPGCSGWAGPYSLGDGTLGSVPSITGPVGGQYLDAAWTGSAGGPRLWWREGGNGLHDLGMGPLNSPPSVIQATYLGSPPPENYQAFWAGTDGALWDGIWSYDPNGGISVATGSPGRLGFGPLGSAPSAAYDSDVTIHVVWQGTNYGLWEATANLLDIGSPWSLHQVEPAGSLDQ